MYAFLTTLLRAVRSHPSRYTSLLSLIRLTFPSADSRLVIHAVTPTSSPLLSLLTTPSFSQALTYVRAHSPALLTHVATSLSTPPPPLSSPEKFWSVFLPIAGRNYDVEELVFGNTGEGSGTAEEMVVEVLLRGESTDGVSRRKKGVERTLEGWLCGKGVAVELKDLVSLRSVFGGRTSVPEVS